MYTKAVARSETNYLIANQTQKSSIPCSCTDHLIMMRAYGIAPSESLRNLSLLLIHILPTIIIFDMLRLGRMSADSDTGYIVGRLGEDGGFLTSGRFLFAIRFTLLATTL